MNKQQPTKNYYYSEGSQIYFGNEEQASLFKAMWQTPIREVEAEVARLNKAGGFVQPVDDDYTDTDGDE